MGGKNTGKMRWGKTLTYGQVKENKAINCYLPTRISKTSTRPNALRSHSIKIIITTILSRFFTQACMGIKRLMAQSMNPTTTRTMITVIRDIFWVDQKGCQ
jgi:hypothetical protein